MLISPRLAFALSLILWVSGASAEGRSLRVVTLNVWHGYVTDGFFRFPDEDDLLPGDPGRKERRVRMQLAAMRELDPDVVFLQEVTRLPYAARRYADALGYDVVQKVSSCGLHLLPLKVPAGFNEGLVILARKQLRLRRVGSVRLSGIGVCSLHAGLQLTETRYALLAEVKHAGDPVLLVNTHLHNTRAVPPDFASKVRAGVQRGELDAWLAEDVLAKRRRSVLRSRAEAERLAAALELRLTRSGERWRRVVVAGDFNAEAGSETLEALLRRGFRLRAGASHATRVESVNPNVGVATSRRGALGGHEQRLLADLYAAGSARPRQIDHILFRGFDNVDQRVVLDQPREGLFASDHFGLLADLAPD